MKPIKLITLGLIGLIIVLALETYTNFDIQLQNLCFNKQQNQWLINPELHKKLTYIFYDGLKIILIFCAVCCLSNMLLSIKKRILRQYNHFCLIMLLSFIFIPALIAGAKAFTNVYCPYQLNLYNGLYPFVRVLDHYPADFIQTKVGKCFPAGHATAGFAFLGLFYAFYQSKYRLIGLLTGLTLGWMAGIYQMLRGQHFLSHTLFSMISALILVVIINQIVLWLERKFPKLTRYK